MCIAPSTRTRVALPDQLHRDLDNPPGRCGTNCAEGRVRKSGALWNRGVWEPEIRVIEQIESLKASLKVQPINQRDVLEQRGIDVFDTRRTKDVPRGIAVIP